MSKEEILANNVQKIKNAGKFLNFRCICILLQLLYSAWKQDQARKQEIYGGAFSVTIWKHGLFKYNFVCTVYNLICRSPLMEIRLLNSPWAKDLLACLVTFTQRKHHDIPPDIYMRYIMKLNINYHDISLQFSEILMSEGPGGENSGNIIVIHPGSLYLRFPSQ